MEPGEDALTGAKPPHESRPYCCIGLSPAGGVRASSSSSGGFVLVIWALAIEVVVKGGAVVLRAGVKLDVRMSDGGPRRRRTDGGREDGAVL